MTFPVKRVIINLDVKKKGCIVKPGPNLKILVGMIYIRRELNSGS